MKNVSNKNNCNQVTVQVYTKQPPIPVIKSNSNKKLDKYCVKNKLLRYPMSEKSYLYEFKMALFDNGDPEELLLFISNFITTLEESGMLVSGAKIQYLHTLLRGEASRQIDTFSFNVGINPS